MPWIEHWQSPDWSDAGWICLGAYSLGCLTTGYYLVRTRTGQDLRALGSGSVGARNVGRLLGWRGFVLTVLGDFCKGALAVWAARHFTTDDRLVLLAMLAVVAGHVWPAQLHFQGGKGMATTLGALLVTIGSWRWRLRSCSAAPLPRCARRWCPVWQRWLACRLSAPISRATRPRRWESRPGRAGAGRAPQELDAEFSSFLERRNLHPKHDSPEL